MYAYMCTCIWVSMSVSVRMRVFYVCLHVYVCSRCVYNVQGFALQKVILFVEMSYHINVLILSREEVEKSLLSSDLICPGP